MGNEIRLKDITGKETKYNVSLSITVYEFKKKIEKKTGNPIGKQRLIYAGKQLEDERTLNDYRIENGSTLHLVLPLKGGNPMFNIKDEMSEFLDKIEKTQRKKMKIHVKTIYGKNFYLDVESTDTIKIIKNKIQILEGIPQNRQRLIFDGKILKNYETLENYDINDKKHIRLVNMNHSIEEEEEEIEAGEEEDEQLIEQQKEGEEEGEEKEEGDNFKEEEEEEEQIIKYNENDKIQIVIKDIWMNEISLTVYKTNKIKEIKHLIQEKKGIDVEMQKLIFGGEILESKRTLKYYKIGNNALLHLVLRIKGAHLEKENIGNDENYIIHIVVEIITVKKIYLDIPGNIKVKQIKNMIQENEGINIEQQRFFFEGCELEDNNTLKFYEIHNESILYVLLKKKNDNKENKKIKIFVKTTDGKIINLEAEPSTTIREVKYKIQDKERIPPTQQRLVYS